MGYPAKKNRAFLRTTVDLSMHIVLTLLLACFFRWLTGGWTWPLLVFVGGILIDVDHFIDYFLYFGMRFNLSDFYCHRQLASGKCRIIFHSWEILIAMWALSIAFSWIIPIASGMTVHILVDYLYSHRCKPLFLSLIYRWYHHFKLEKLCPGLCVEK